MGVRIVEGNEWEDGSGQIGKPAGGDAPVSAQPPVVSEPRNKGWLKYRWAGAVMVVAAALHFTDPQERKQVPVKEAATLGDKTPAPAHVYYDFDSSGADDYSAVEKFVAAVAENREACPAVLVTGSSSFEGPEEYNQVLSEFRADGIKEILNDQLGALASRLNAPRLYVGSVGIGEKNATRVRPEKDRVSIMECVTPEMAHQGPR